MGINVTKALHTEPDVNQKNTISIVAKPEKIWYTGEETVQ